VDGIEDARPAARIIAKCDLVATWPRPDRRNGQRDWHDLERQVRQHRDSIEAVFDLRQLREWPALVEVSTNCIQRSNHDFPEIYPRLQRNSASPLKCSNVW
jgi:hypothetical protein